MHQPNLLAAHGDVRRRPKGTAALVPRLIAALRGRGWVSARVLSRELGVDVRTIREAAHESAGEVASGQSGYALTVEVPVGELDRVIGRFYSQAREMRQRGLELERVRHRRGPIEEGDATWQVRL